jgi:hypothetical protein
VRRKRRTSGAKARSSADLIVVAEAPTYLRSSDKNKAAATKQKATADSFGNDRKKGKSDSGFPIQLHSGE